MIEAIKQSGVTVITECEVIDWVLENDGDYIFVNEVIIEQKGDRGRLKCDVFVNFKEKTINQDTFLGS